MEAGAAAGGQHWEQDTISCREGRQPSAAALSSAITMKRRRLQPGPAHSWQAVICGRQDLQTSFRPVVYFVSHFLLCNIH